MPGMSNQIEFQEIYTLMAKGNQFKLQVIPIIGGGPTALMGFHYSSKWRM
jgi:hypothetical protein